MQKDYIIEKEWKNELKSFLGTQEWSNFNEFINSEYRTKKVFPEYQDIFRAFYLTPFSKVKVVIVGQDPYHNEGQAHGLSFSVKDGVRVPPSLKNMYKEISSDIGTEKDFSIGNLESWARQGVFLLNSILTVVAHTPASHEGKGWETFTDTVIKKISDNHEHIVFMLWGNYARSKKELIDDTKHLVLEAAHPSPFSAYTGFYGCKHFSKCNAYLKKYGNGEVKW